MRRSDQGNGSLSSYVDLGQRVRPDHPLRVIREIANVSLKALSADFDALYSPFGRKSIAPERLVRALLLQTFYSIRFRYTQTLSSRGSGMSSVIRLIDVPRTCTSDGRIPGSNATI